MYNTPFYEYLGIEENRAREIANKVENLLNQYKTDTPVNESFEKIKELFTDEAEYTLAVFSLGCHTGGMIATSELIEKIGRAIRS